MTEYKFGSYIYPFVEQVAAPTPARIGSADTPGRAGSYTGRRYAAARQVKIGGTLLGSSFNDLLVKWSQLVSSHETPDPQRLYVRDGWYLWAQAESVDDSERGIGHISYEVNLRCSDPFYYSDTIRTASIAGTGSTTVTSYGTTYALPQITLSISASPVNSSITVTNVATGDFITLSPTANETIVIDSRLETITVSGGADRMNLMLSGHFPRIAALPHLATTSGTVNQIQVATAGGATLSSVSISFQDRSL